MRTAPALRPARDLAPAASSRQGASATRLSRRNFLHLAGCIAAIAAGGARAQTVGSSVPVIGFLNGGSPYEWSPFVEAFRGGLGEIGYLEGRNAGIEFRWAFGDGQQLPALARDLVERQVAVIVSTAGNQPTIAAQRATKTIPIVATFGNDPIKAGIITALEKPGGNVTGISLIAHGLEAKQLELLRQVARRSSSIGVLIDPFPGILDPSRYEEAAAKIGQRISFIPASTDAEIDKAFVTMKQQGVNALLVASTAYFLGRRDRLTALAARSGITAMYPARSYVEAGGLISYGVDRLEIYRELGVYVGRILRGGLSAGELPVREPSKFELALNLKAAKALGITIPPSLVTLADIVIE